MRTLAILAAACFALPADTKVTPAQEIKGSFADNKDLPKMKEVPASGILADEKAFAKLWTSWRGNAVPPKVDFQKQFVYVATGVCAANRISGDFVLTEKG